MNPLRSRVLWTILCNLIVWGFPQHGTCQEEKQSPQSAEKRVDFVAEAKALPYPPDAREIEFRAVFKRIEFMSGSSLGALADFYRRQMADRGWKEDEAETTIEVDSVEITFKHDGAQVELELDKRSKGTIVRMACKGLDFSETDDPAKLLAAGVPQPRAYLFLQKEIPLPEKFERLTYSGSGCMFYCPMKFLEAFQHYVTTVKGLGWQQSLRVLESDNRRYTEFKKGPVTLSVNIFSDPVGSRIVLGYKDERQEKLVAALPDAALKIPGKNGDEPTSTPVAEPAANTPVNVAKNIGRATITFGDKKYVFPHAAAIQLEGRDEPQTLLIFSERAIPMQKLQAQLAKNKDEFRFFDLYEFETPGYLRVELNKYHSYSFSADGAGIGQSVDDPIKEVKIENGRIQATVKMHEAEEILSRPFQFEVVIDAGLITPTTRLTNVTDPPANSPNPFPPLGDGLPLPEGATDRQSEGTKYRKSVHATVAMELGQVEAFYQNEQKSQKWQVDTPEKSGSAEQAKTAPDVRLAFKTSTGPLTVELRRNGNATSIQIVSRNDAKAKEDGILPEAGKARLVMGNAGTQDVVISIGKNNYTIKAGRGAKDPKTALNYSVPPGKYPITIKIPGENPQSETLDITIGTTWGVLTLPTGGYFASQLY